MLLLLYILYLRSLHCLTFNELLNVISPTVASFFNKQLPELFLRQSTIEGALTRHHSVRGTGDRCGRAVPGDVELLIQVDAVLAWY
jgi:hypothetical protein